MLALIDGDVIAYLCCKSRLLTPEENMLILLDKTTKTFTREEDRHYLQKSWENFKKMVDTLMEAAFCTDCLIAVKSPSNFRDAVYSDYKANRKKPPELSNKFVPAIRTLAVMEDMAIEATGREADDMLNIWAMQAIEAGDPYIVVSNDKDLKCIPGKHYNPKSNEFFSVSEIQAKRSLYMQLLSGDPTDNVPGLPNIGPKKAHSYIVNLHDEDEMQAVVVEMYMTKFGDDWHNMLLSNGKMVYIQKHEHDYFAISHWPVVKSLTSVPVEEVIKIEQPVITIPKGKIDASKIKI